MAKLKVKVSDPPKQLPAQGMFLNRVWPSFNPLANALWKQQSLPKPR